MLSFPFIVCHLALIRHVHYSDRITISDSSALPLHGLLLRVGQGAAIPGLLDGRL